MSWNDVYNQLHNTIDNIECYLCGFFLQTTSSSIYHIHPRRLVVYFNVSVCQFNDRSQLTFPRWMIISVTVTFLYQFMITLVVEKRKKIELNFLIWEEEKHFDEFQLRTFMHFAFVTGLWLFFFLKQNPDIVNNTMHLFSLKNISLTMLHSLLFIYLSFIRTQCFKNNRNKKFNFNLCVNVGI